MTTDIREIAPEQMADFNSVSNWVYLGRQAPEGSDEYMTSCEDSRDFVAYVDGRPASACRATGYRIARGEADMPCGGIACVGTLAEFRQTGVGTALMSRALYAMREQGQVLAALYAFKESYYRRVGYEACGWRWQIRCPQAALPKTNLSLPVRRIEAADVHLLDQAYLPFIRGMSGSNVRTPFQWQVRMGRNAPMIYAVGDPIEAYAWLGVEGFWRDLTVGEMAWSTRRGYESILAVLRSLCSNQEALVWLEPPSSPFLARFQDHGVAAERNRISMFRVTDVPAALRALKPATSGSFAIAVDDDVMPENRGPWKVAFEPGHVEVKPADSADLVLDVRHFVQALLGSPSLQELLAAGLVDVSRRDAVEPACRLLNPMPVVCMEFF